MRITSIGFAIAAFAATHLVATAHAQQTLPGDRPPRSMAAKPVDLAESFSGVRGLRSLPDGRVVVSDATENALYLVDFTRGTRTPLSRKGNGPREFQRASLVHPAAGGGLLVADPMLRRFLPVSNAGEVGDGIPYPTLGSEVGMSASGPDLYTPDTLGKPFGSVYRAARTPRATNDSTHLVRLDRGEKRDTVARLRVAESRCVSTGPNSNMCRTVDFSPGDIWAVAPDGWVAIVRASPYHVEWFPPRGTPTIGASIAFTPTAVPKAEKDSIIEAAKNPRGGPSMSMGAVKSGAPSGSAPALRSGVDPVILDEKPAFHWSQLPVVDAAGRIWIERHRAFGSKSGRVYDVVDRRGALVNRVALPPRTKLVAVDSRWLFAVRVDDDDLQYLQRYPLP
jgi:hypothetical protein